MRMMFTIDPIHPVYSAVIEVLSIFPRMTVADLRTQLKKSMKIDISQAQLYRIVTRMVETQLLLRVDGRLSLDLMWMSYVEFIAGRAKRILQHGDEFPLQPGQKRKYEANSLLHMEAI